MSDDEQKPEGKPEELSYRVVCISLYHEDIAAIDKMVAELRARGFRRASRSWLLRVAMYRLDIDTVTDKDRAL